MELFMIFNVSRASETKLKFCVRSSLFQLDMMFKNELLHGKVLRW